MVQKASSWSVSLPRAMRRKQCKWGIFWLHHLHILVNVLQKSWYFSAAYMHQGFEVTCWAYLPLRRQHHLRGQLSDTCFFKWYWREKGIYKSDLSRRNAKWNDYLLNWERNENTRLRKIREVRDNLGWKSNTRRRSNLDRQEHLMHSEVDIQRQRRRYRGHFKNKSLTQIFSLLSFLQGRSQLRKRG
jgi:hypothetical protein